LFSNFVQSYVKKCSQKYQYYPKKIEIFYELNILKYENKVRKLNCSWTQGWSLGLDLLPFQTLILRWPPLLRHATISALCPPYVSLEPRFTTNPSCWHAANSLKNLLARCKLFEELAGTVQNSLKNWLGTPTAAPERHLATCGDAHIPQFQQLMGT
jgi:hypothetical protein